MNSIDSKNTPKVSVIMAAYNVAPYITDTINSILNQTMQDFELIIVDDASTDNTLEIMSSFDDERIRVFSNKENSGNHFSRNLAMEHATGEYIAFMDADDLMRTYRLKMQVDFLEQHPDIGMATGGMQLFGESDNITVLYPTEPDYIKAFLFLKNCIVLPSVMIRRRLIKEHGLRFDITERYLEDEKLWYAISETGIKIAGIRTPLFDYRIHSGQESNLFLQQRRTYQKKFLKEKLESTLQLILPDKTLDLLFSFIHTRIEIQENEFDTLNRVLYKIRSISAEKGLFNETALNAVLYFYFLRLGKYYYLVYKNSLLQFAYYMFKTSISLGLKGFLKFMRNERHHFFYTQRSNVASWNKL